MSQKEIDKLFELSQEALEKGNTKEESLQTLVEAGIMTENGKFTEPYQDLSEIIKVEK